MPIPELELGEIVQIAYVVPSIEEAIPHWVALGAGPFFSYPRIPLDARYEGAPAVYDHSAAFGQWGNLQVELIEVHEASPAGLAEGMLIGRYGLQHVAMFVASVPEYSAVLESRGWPLVMELTTRTSGNPVAFHDASRDLGHLLEIYPLGPGQRELYGMVARAAQGWDGSDPLRPLVRR